MLIAAGEKLHTAFQTLVNITESQRLELARLELEQAKAKVMALENPQIPVQQSKPNPATYSATNPFNTYVQQQQQQQQQPGAPQPDFNPYLPSAIQQSDNPYMSNGHVPAQSYSNKVQVTNTEGSAYERAYNSSNPFADSAATQYTSLQGRNVANAEMSSSNAHNDTLYEFNGLQIDTKGKGKQSMQ
ncbi:hypothetical protein BC833DRAFT_446113 [Globomyces pollinis-pini]|nr:hypothetical protein BC833DRAFT_446113 [Globomyces pollinis-pini]